MNMREFEDSLRKGKTPSGVVWSFCVNPDPDYDEEKEQKNHHREMVKESLLSWKKLLAEDYPDEAFPKFLWEPQMNDYGDDFAYLDSKKRATNSILHQAANLHRVYSDYFDWVDAMEIWKEYLAYIITEYGSYEHYVEGIRAGYFSGAVATEPKLKKFAGSKALRRITVAISRRDEDKTDWDGIDAILGEMPVHEWTPEELEDSGKIDHRFDRIDGLLINDIRREQRINEVLNGRGRSNPTMDIIMDFISNGDSAKSRRILKGIGASFAEEIEDMKEAELINPEMYDQELDKMVRRGIFFDAQSGSYVSDNNPEEEVINAMLEAGFEINGLVKNSGLSRSAKKMIQRKSADLYGDYTPKQLKKMEKKRKKFEANQKRALANDQKIQNILFDNRFAPEIGSDGTLNFTLSSML